MRGEMQISLEPEPNHRALRRCFSCGTYARPFDEVNGAVRCQRCAEKARRSKVENEDFDRSRVDFLL